MEALRECVGTRNVPFEGYIDHGILIRSRLTHAWKSLEFFLFEDELRRNLCSSA